MVFSKSEAKAEASRAVGSHGPEAFISIPFVLRHRSLRDGNLSANDFGDLDRELLRICNEIQAALSHREAEHIQCRHQAASSESPV